ncbi:MAG: SusC/RagA family TonB-linked outer membrane protein [Bacteroides sp.]|nr:SusC/RagA family TonB-linked outer membrane protein [Bacteroides sp.]
MQTQEVAIKPHVKVVMGNDAELLDEVVVVAYGTAKKAAFTGSASTIKTEQLEKRQVSNVTQALSGAVAGVQTLSDNGQPGTTAKVRIRGIGSINAGSSPLYVVDGVPYDGDLASINNADIETMTVLKDAASSALYGARGANGVIIITTKKGKTGKAKVNFDARIGVNQRGTRNYDVLQNPATYMEKAYEAIYNGQIYNQGKTAAEANMLANQILPTNQTGGLGYQIYTVPQGQQLIGLNGKLNPNATLGYSDGKNYYTPDNWRDETYKNNTRQEYNLSVSGGGEKLNYYISMGYLDDKGLIDNSGYERYSLRAKGDYDIQTWLKMGASMSYVYSNSRYPGEQTTTNSSGNAFLMANMIAPVYPMYIRNADGSKMLDSRGRVVYDYGDAQYSAAKRGSFMPGANPVGNLLYDKEAYMSDALSTNWYATITPIEGLKFTARIGLDVNNRRYNALSNPYYGQFADGGGSATQVHDRYYGFDQQYIANYTKTFNEVHNLDVMVGYDGYSYHEDEVQAYGTNLYNPNIGFVNNTIDNKSGYGSADSYATVGVIARANYDYAEKYYFSASYRRDASSRFHPDNRWGDFYSASAAWVMNKEAFMENISWIDLLKLKVSYGQQGNDQILDLKGYDNYYPYLDQYRMTGANGIFADGTLYYKGNKDLTWETTHAFNLGVDFELWKGKLSGTVEYFSRKSSDMLYNKPVAPTAGYSTIPMNIGSMTNSGLEIDLSSRIFDTNDLKWDVNLNATFLKNKINELHPDLNGELIDGTRIYSEGESMYRMYLVQYLGVDSETGKVLYYAEDKDGNPITTSTYSVAASYKKATDDLLPTVYGGFGTTLTFHGFDASIQFAYQLGGTIYDSGYASLMHGGSGNYAGRNWHKDILNSWNPNNTNTNVPRVDSNDSDNDVMGTSDRFLTSSDYLSINNITIGYTLPKKLLQKIGVEKLRVYCASDNVALFTARAGLDPRQSYTSATSARYTPARTISGGLSLTF